MLSWFTLGGLLLAVPVVAAANPAPDVPTDSALLKAGTWVEYVVFHRLRGQAVRLKLAALEGDARRRWIEIAMTGPQGQKLIQKLLVSSSADGKFSVERAVLQPPYGVPFELPVKLLKRSPKLAGFKRPPPRGSGERTTVKVAAGTFRARRVVWPGVAGQAKTEAWFAETPMPWPLLRLHSPQLLIELRDHGGGAKSAISAQTRPMDKRVLRQLGIQP